MNYKKFAFIAVAAMAICLAGCKDKNTAPTPTDTPADTDTTQVKEREAATSDTHRFTKSGVTIHKQWVSNNEDGTAHMFDLTDENNFAEAMTFPEALCKSKAKYGLKQNQFYFIKQSPKYKVLLFKDYDETSGDVSFLIMQGADNNSYQFRFSYSNLTADKVTISYQDGSSYVYTALDKPEKIELAPKFQDDRPDLEGIIGI